VVRDTFGIQFVIEPRLHLYTMGHFIFP